MLQYLKQTMFQVIKSIKKSLKAITLSGLMWSFGDSSGDTMKWINEELTFVSPSFFSQFSNDSHERIRIIPQFLVKCT